MWMLMTIVAAATAGLLLMKLRVPGGMLVGAIIGAAALNLITQRAFIYPETRVIAQSLTGAYIGCMVSKQDILHLPKLVRPYLMVMTSLLVLNLAIGSIIYYITDFDLLTCLFCAAPGGVSDTPLIAMDMGADSSVVAVMQFVRMLFGMGCLPTIILLSDRDADQNLEIHSDREHPQVKLAKARPTLIGFFPVFSLVLPLWRVSWASFPVCLPGRCPPL